MRRLLPACRTGLAVAAALVALSACSGSEETGTAAAESGRPSPTAAAERADPAFCDEAAAIQDRVGATLGRQSDPAALPPALRQAATEIRAVEPPERIAADWYALADGVEQVATALATTNFEDPTARAAFEEQVGQLQGQLTSASANVGDYLRDECGIGPGTSTPAGPSS